MSSQNATSPPLLEHSYPSFWHALALLDGGLGMQPSSLVGSTKRSTLLNATKPPALCQTWADGQTLPSSQLYAVAYL